MTDIPDLKIKALVSFPATVTGGIATTVEKINGKFYIDHDVSALPKNSGITPEQVAQSWMTIWNEGLDTYQIVPYALAATSGVASIDGKTGAIDIGPGLTSAGQTLNLFLATEAEARAGVNNAHVMTPYLTALLRVVKCPEDYGAVGDGITDDAIPLQAWADALRNGGIGAAKSAAGYNTSATITFMPSILGPVIGPTILGNLRLIGHANLPVNSDLLRIWSRDVIAPDSPQDFYYPRFDSIDVSNATGTGNGVSIRGYWGSIRKIFARDVYDGVSFPPFSVNGATDSYESMCNLGDVTGINCRGFVLNNAMGLGASITAGNVRGTVLGDLLTTPTLGCVRACGSEHLSGCIAYTGRGVAVLVNFGTPPAIQTGAHEVYMQGNGDIDVAQYGFDIQSLEFGTITGHRMNVEPPYPFGIPIPASWPLKCYSFGKPTQDGRIVDVTVHAYITIRPGVTAANIGDVFDFNNDPNIANLQVYATINDGSGVNISGTFANVYKNISPTATIKIVQNGTVVYDNTATTAVVQLPPASLGLRGVRRCVNDSNTAVFNAPVAPGGFNVVGVICNGTNWVVG